LIIYDYLILDTGYGVGWLEFGIWHLMLGICSLVFEFLILNPQF